MENMEEMLRRHKEFFRTGQTLDVDYRIRALDRLYRAIEKYEDAICSAIYCDIGKAREESYMCEVGLALSEISFLRKHLHEWADPRRVSTGLGNFPAVSRIVQEPYGTVLVMAPWNYPFLLSIQPLAGAISAGNTVVLKPSNYSPATSAVLKQLLEETFGPGHVSVILGGREENKALLEQKFDYIFFTGSAAVGREVMTKAAAHLTPVSLELGGKSPCIVDCTAKLKLAARRIAFGKNLNCGQTCVAPDYLLIDASVKDEFLYYYAKAVQHMYGKEPLKNANYGKIINQKHFQRLLGLMDPDKLIFGGEYEEEELRIAPAVLDGVTAEDPIMQQEIFGPILPVLTFETLAEAETFVLERPKPLALLLVNGSVNPEVVGRSPAKIAALAGFSVPEDTKILIGEVESVEVSEPFAHEKLSPILAMYKAHDIYDAIAKAEHLVSDGGRGHTSSIYLDTINDRELMDKFARHMCTGRVLVNTPAAQGGLGDLYNFRMTPSLTLGCGSWGSNSISENVGVKHLLNIKTVAERRENMLWFRSPEKVYIKKGCLPVALMELGTMGKKRAFIVTGKHLFASGALKPIEEKLDALGIVYQVFYDVASDPTLACARTGAEQMRLFQPDVIIAVGGGSPMDAAKIMWVLYEHPDADFGEMAMRFADIRKRVYTFPHMGEKAYFVAIPTSAGTGSEVTPFAVITDEKNGIKYPLADYELMPDMAIVDADMNMTAPKSLTASSGIDAAVHALEAYASMMATDYTDGLALRALKLIFEYLPRAYDNGTTDYVAREMMSNAATMAGMAFANAFLGVCHSMAHKLGAFHHVAHGTANALMLEEVLRFNASERPTKMGTFSQYDHPDTLHRYAEIADSLGLGGADDSEKLENLIRTLNELKARVGLKKSIRDYVPDEKAFLETLDEMSEQAFDDQCTAANPRYPLISEIRQMYLNAYYCGDEKKTAEEQPAAETAKPAKKAAKK